MATGATPVVLYDKAAKRWVVGQMNVNLNAYCMAVSTTLGCDPKLLSV